MQLSVVILNYNVRFFLEQCVESVQKAIQNLDAEIIVVDNNSPDDSCPMIKAMFPNVVLIENKENSGFPKGNNIGVARAKGKYICILNPDTVVAEDTFEKVLAFAESKKDLGIVGCKLIDGTGHFLPESKRGIPTPWVAFTKVTGLYKLSDAFGKYYASHLQENQTGKVEILVGAFMVMTRETYTSVGGFDEDCFMYSDDIDLSYMVLKTGKSNYYFHETSVIHYKGESTVRDGLYMKRFREAMDFFYRKHFRVNFLFDVFMQTGAFVFTLAKKNKVVEAKRVAQYRLVSDDETLLAKIASVTGKNIDFQAETAQEETTLLSNTEMIFDADHLTFRQIISRMEMLKEKGMTFKIAHKKSGFLIGSNSSNDRGEVILLTDYR
ncbi:glycosyltransferase family 2 protein [Flavobacterium caeni]|uniref:Glycosyltransferase, GT2 family n=1 Tax=Flavobacterium caeni TaxID=490189 RepID=A0A1G5AM11_9FLAO|nr:glycosyltransferase family 2 protein [Flavobacterium caeni]SCX78891.1 Glycosyltransferase, GT2 family [Flavobacterium caeni]